MAVFKIRLAEKVIEADCLLESTRRFCRDYICDEDPDVTIRITPEDLENEKQYVEEGVTPREAHLETNALYRKIAEYLLQEDVILFHGSAIMMDSEVYLFTAPSGTGKSTHTRLWRETFTDHEIHMVNDDKPLIRMTETGFEVYGTPWNGKHGLSENIHGPLKAVCFLNQAKENRIAPLEKDMVLPKLMSQTYRSEDPARLIASMRILDRISKTIPVYTLDCTISKEAALLSYTTMNQKENSL